jgi:hypothetical protein
LVVSETSNSWVYLNALICQETSSNCGGSDCPTTKLVLLTSVFIILGPQNTCRDVVISYADPTPYINFSAKTFNGTDINSFRNTGYGGIFSVSNPTTGVITSRVKTESKTNSSCIVSICQIIPLGYPCCYIKTLTDTTPIINTYMID